MSTFREIRQLIPSQPTADGDVLKFVELQVLTTRAFHHF